MTPTFFAKQPSPLSPSAASVGRVDAALSIIDEHRKTQTWKQWKIYLVYEIQFSTLATFLMKTIYAELQGVRRSTVILTPPLSLAWVD